jgi:hypothetical protein
MIILNMLVESNYDADINGQNPNISNIGIVHNIQFKESTVFGQGKRLFTLSGTWAIRRIKSGYVLITVAILRIFF